MNVGGGATVSAIVVLAVRVPETPVMVTVDVPLAAVFGTANVTVLPVVVLAALNVAVIPVGMPDAVSATVPVKPFNAFTVMFAIPLNPGPTLKAAGVGDSVKVGGGVTVTAMVALPVSAPEVPVTITWVVVAAAVVAAVKVRVLVVLVVGELNTAVTPAGKPVTARLTVPVKPLCGFAVRVLLPLLPARMEKAVGVAVRVKPGAAVTVTAMVVLLLSDPEVAVMVTVEVPGTALAVALKVTLLV
jgi:hypothetical protein